jgi:hypothetical protein
MVDVEQRTLSSFEQHPSAFPDGPVHQETGVRGKGKQAGCKTLQQAQVVLEPGALATAHHLEQPVRASHPVLQEAPGAFQAAQIGHPDATPAVLVFVRRPDPTSGSAQILAPFAGGVEQLVVRQNQMGAVGDEDPAFGIDAAGVELVQLGKKVLRLQYDAVTDYAGDLGMQDARRDLAEDELGIADDYRVARIGPTLIPHDEIGPFGEHVNQLTLAFVSPLRPDDHHAGGLGIEHVGSLG